MSSSSSRSQPSRGNSAKPTRAVEPVTATPLLLRLVDVGILGALIGVPLALGGKSPLGQLILVSCVAWSAVAWSLSQLQSPHRPWNWTWGYCIMVGAIGLSILQVTELPPDVLAAISPHHAEILPLWQSGGPGAELLGVWSTTSLTPAATKTGLITITAYSLLFLVVVQRIQELRDVERLLRWIAGSTAAMAIFGLLQYLSSNGKFFWFIEHFQATTDVVPLGAFPNRNHFAHFLAFGFAPLFIYVLSLINRRESGSRGFGSRPTERGRSDFVAALGVAVVATVAVTLMFSLSRGGMLALVTSVVACLVILYFKRAIPGRIAAAIASVGIVIGGYLAIHGYDQVTTRLDNWDTKGRREIWQANAKVLADFPIVGTGIGSHRFAHKLHWDHPELAVECSHAESSLVQIASESGIVGITLVGFGVLLCFSWCLTGVRRSRDSRHTMALAAVSASLSASLAHSAFDVVWHIPGIMVGVVVLAACACGLCQLLTDKSMPAERPAMVLWPMAVRLGAVATIVLVASGTSWVVRRTLPRIESHGKHLEYLTLAHAAQEEGGDVESPLKRLEQRMTVLERAVELDPENSDLQRHLAFHCLSVFEVRQASGQNPMSAAQIRQAVQASTFSSGEEMQDWLDRAIGENVGLLKKSLLHARRSLALCPLHASAYVQIAELGFLEDPAADDSSDLLAQARLVNPTNAYVRFNSGREAWLAGDAEQGIKHWQVSFRQSKHYRQQIIAAISANLSAKFLLDNFEFDWDALEQLKTHYESLGGSDEMSLVLTAHARGSIDEARRHSGSRAVPFWLAARNSLDALERADLAEKCLAEAARTAPFSFEVRYEYGKWLLERDRFAEAAEHLAWCTRRKPADAKVLELAEAAVKGKIRHADTAATDISEGRYRR